MHNEQEIAISRVQEYSDAISDTGLQHNQSPGEDGGASFAGQRPLSDDQGLPSDEANGESHDYRG